MTIPLGNQSASQVTAIASSVGAITSRVAANKSRVPLTQHLNYSLGMFAPSALIVFSRSFLLFFYSQSVGLSPKSEPTMIASWL